MSTKYLNLDTDPTMTANSDYTIASQKAIKTALATKQNTLSQGTGISISNDVVVNTAPNVQSDWNATSGSAVILNKPSLATVATSGNYNDLSNKPSEYSLPTATDTTLGGIKIGEGLQIASGVAKVVSVVNQNGGGLIKFWAGTQAEYALIQERDPDTIYLIRS